MNMTEANSSWITTPPAFSVIVAVDAQPTLRAMLETCRGAFDAMGQPYEVFCAIDGRGEALLADLRGLAAIWPELTVLGQRPWLDEDAAMQAAVKRARGERVLTLAGWPEIAPEAFARLLEGLDSADMVVASRTGQGAGMRGKVLRGTLRSLFGRSVSDLFCRTRAARKPVLEEAAAFGVRQHFLPTIAAELGHTVTEIDVAPAPQSAQGETKFVFKPLGHLRALFDALTLYVVLKFLRRPLRFFGAVGLPVFLVGAAITTFYLVMRLFGGWALADRPGLIFAVLMVVLGLQIIALGLVGEIIIFANSRRMKQYTVKSVIRQDPGA